ncbi:type II toxin-antitoxin system RelE/ParE family toxin [Rhizobium sp. 0TCS1.26]|uniref:type II toxin-antitoxin system RelE/ParE family toxin n=1 Tax=Rhizobium sp. 0TCS1.26 TaxID=3142623 RepID=UPI003D2A249F
MRRLPVVYRLVAIEDLENTYLFILEVSGSSKVASGFVERIMARCRRIGNVPSGGRPRDDLAPGLRVVPFERAAVIAYVMKGDRVEITNVFYGGRDYEALLRGKPGAA